MNAQQFQQLQDARRRIARSRQMAERDALRLSQQIGSKINLRLQSQRHPVAMMLGAAAAGMAASRLLSSVAGGAAESGVFSFVKQYLRPAVWKEMLQTLFASSSNEESGDGQAAREGA